MPLRAAIKPPAPAFSTAKLTPLLFLLFTTEATTQVLDDATSSLEVNKVIFISLNNLLALQELAITTSKQQHCLIK